MATLNKFVYNIQNIIGRGESNTDDRTLTNRQVAFWIEYYRSKIINEFTNYGKNIHPQLVQDLGIVPLVEVDATDSDCPEVQWGCTVKKAIIPKIVDFPSNRALSFVGKINKFEPIIMGTADTDYYKSKTRFGKILTRATLINQNLYINTSESDVDISYINVRGVFESPSEVNSYSEQGCEPKCYDPQKDEYPLTLNMYSYIVENILGKELGWTQQSINDEIGNAREDFRAAG